MEGFRFVGAKKSLEMIRIPGPIKRFDLRQLHSELQVHLATRLTPGLSSLELIYGGGG